MAHFVADHQRCMVVYILKCYDNAMKITKFHIVKLIRNHIDRD